MNDDIYSDMAIEQTAKDHFGLRLEVDHVIVRNVPVSHVAHATVFLTNKKQLYLYINATSRLLLSDVKTIASRMGIVCELYLPPKGQPHYFDDIGRQKFREVFPARTTPSPEDIRYYRTLAPYNPALIQVAEIKHGDIKQFDIDASGNWRTAAKSAYRRIKTSG